MSSDVVERVRALAQEVSVREGCLLYDVEFTGGPSGRVLRVYIDRVEGVVSVNDCANVSRGLNLLLDVEDVVPGGHYDLEVSSPGLERRLTQAWHFERAVGQPVRVRMSEPVTGGLEDVKAQTLLEGKILKVENGVLVLEKDGKNWNVNLGQVAKANVRFVEPEKTLPGKKKR